MESMLGSRRRSKKVKSVLHWCFRNNHFRALQGHSGRNLIDPSLQDNVVIESEFVHDIYHCGCAFNLHSIINSGLILGGRSSSRRQTVFLLVDSMNKRYKDLDVIDLSVPRHAQNLHKAWKRHQDAVFWVDINLASEKRWTFYQTRSNTNILQETLPAYCFPKVVRMEPGEVIYEKYTCHNDLFWNTNGNETQVQNTVNVQKLGSYLEVSNRTNQL